MTANPIRYTISLIALWITSFMGQSVFAQSFDSSAFTAKLTADIEQVRARVVAVTCKASVEVVICKGAMTESAEQRFRKRLAVDLPANDEVMELTKSFLLDFVSGHFLAEGTDHRSSLQLDPSGSPSLTLFRQWATTAFDGTHFRTLTPREKLHQRSIPPGIRYPVEFWESKPDGADPFTFDIGLLPLFWCGGAISDQAITAKTVRGELPLRRWRAALAVNNPSSRMITLTSPPGRYGEYCQFVIPEGGGFHPVKSIFNDGKHVSSELDVSWDDTDQGRLPRQWFVKRFRRDGQLKSQEHFKVHSVRLNPPVNADSFVLLPRKGMIVESRDGKSLVFAVHGEQFQASTNYELNNLIDRQWHWMALLLFALAVIVAIALIALRWRPSLFHT